MVETVSKGGNPVIAMLFLFRHRHFFFTHSSLASEFEQEPYNPFDL